MENSSCQASTMGCSSTLRAAAAAGGSCTAPARVAMATSDAQGDEIAMAPAGQATGGRGHPPESRRHRFN